MTNQGIFPKIEGDIFYAVDVNTLEKAQLNNFITSTAFSGISNIPTALPIPSSFAYRYNTGSVGNTLGNVFNAGSSQAGGVANTACAGSTMSRYFVGSTAYQSSGKILSGTTVFTGSVTGTGVFTPSTYGFITSSNGGAGTSLVTSTIAGNSGYTFLYWRATNSGSITFQLTDYNNTITVAVHTSGGGIAGSYFQGNIDISGNTCWWTNDGTENAGSVDISTVAAGSRFLRVLTNAGVNAVCATQIFWMSAGNGSSSITCSGAIEQKYFEKANSYFMLRPVYTLSGTSTISADVSFDGGTTYQAVSQANLASGNKVAVTTPGSSVVVKWWLGRSGTGLDYARLHGYGLTVW